MLIVTQDHTIMQALANFALPQFRIVSDVLVVQYAQFVQLVLPVLIA